MMEWLTEAVKAGRDALSTQVSRFKNREFMEAVVAGCAMVAAADGNISPAEKQKMIKFIGLSEELKIFNTTEVIAAFNRTAEKFDFDLEVGCEEALRVVSKLKTSSEAARIMVRVCCVIGASDGNFDDDEKKAVSRICHAVGLNPADFSLPV